MTRTKQQAGFTLVELLAALVVSSLLLSLMSLTLWGVQDRQSSMQATSQSLVAKEHLTRFLQTVLSQALPYHPDGSDVAFFEGSGTSLAFFGPAPAALQDFGVLRYQIKSSIQPGKLPVLSLSAALPWSEDLEESSNILNGFETLGFEYLEASEEDAPPQWRTQWQERGTLPVAVKVTAALSGLPKETFTQLVKLDRPVSPYCRYDSLSRGCAR